MQKQEHNANNFWNKEPPTHPNMDKWEDESNPSSPELIRGEQSTVSSSPDDARRVGGKATW
jgi:hypothetical protein